MTLRSSAYFRVRGQSQSDAVSEVLDVLSEFDRAKYRVDKVDVQEGPNESIRIILTMEDQNPTRADLDSDRATDAIVRLLQKSPHRSNWHERQRELTELAAH